LKSEFEIGFESEFKIVFSKCETNINRVGQIKTIASIKALTEAGYIRQPPWLKP